MSVRPLPPGHTREPLAEQTARLARFICDEVPGEPSQSQGAVDTAIRVMRELLADRQAVQRIEALAEEDAARARTCRDFRDRAKTIAEQTYYTQMVQVSEQSEDRIRRALGGAS